MASKHKSKLNNNMSPRIVNIVVVLMLVVLSLAILGNSMTKLLGRDEQMYCTGGVLLAQGKMIYRDFSYSSQLPYHPLLYAILFKGLNTTRYLLVGRLVSVVSDVLVMLCIVAVYRRAFGSFRIWGALLGLCAAILYVYNPAVDYANGYAWNNDVVVFCVALSFLLFTKIDLNRKTRYWRVAAIGALLTMATFMRMTTILAELLFLLALLSLPAKSIKERAKTILPFLIAAAVVSIYPVFVLAQAPKASFINIFRIHMLNSEWLRQIGFVHNKFRLVFTYLTLPGYFVLFIIAAYLILALILLDRKLKIPSGRSALLAGFLAAAFFVIALSLPTIWRQYLAPPVPFLILSFAYPLALLRERSGRKLSKVPFTVGVALMGFGVLVGVVTDASIMGRIPAGFAPKTWAPMKVHRIATDIAEKTKEPKLILTTAPLFALEGGCEIYTELSAGVFAYRIGNLMSKEDRRITHTVGPQMLGELVRQSPPSAIIVGVEPPYFSRLEEPLESLAKADWKRKDYENGPVVYFRP